MPAERNYVMSIAGFDPSGGAGLLADVKTFEQHKVYGLSLSTGSTMQTDKEFRSVRWVDIETVLEGVNLLLDTYPVKVIKIGIVPSFDFLLRLVKHIRSWNHGIKVIVDPITRTSTGFDLHPGNKQDWKPVLENIYLLTPNIPEAVALSGVADAESAAKVLSDHCHVLLKGGHSEAVRGVDRLFTKGKSKVFQPELENLLPKHGSGCVLSAAIAANIALGFDLETSCARAKKYVEGFLNSTPSLLGFHYV